MEELYLKKDFLQIFYDYFCIQVGGPLSSTIRHHMKDFGRIAVCGSISTYNDPMTDPTMTPTPEVDFITKQLKMEGFFVGRWTSRWMEGLTQMSNWIQEV